jgi:flagellar basal-body rod modification protein FlgD
MQISNQPTQNLAFQAVPNAAGTTATSSTNSASTASTATITANDFLQLLVTELQNQDPTANTDPNEYVDQLVQVNSLQQQIQMNQTLDGGPTLSGASNGVLQELAQMNQTLDGAASGTSSSNSSAIASITSSHGKAHAAAAPGNLSSTSATEKQVAAKTVATALAPTPHAAAASAESDSFEELAARLKANSQIK